MADGVTVRLHRPQPGEPRVLGFSYHLQEDQLAYLLTEAKVGSAQRQTRLARCADPVNAVCCLGMPPAQARRAPTPVFSWLFASPATHPLLSLASPGGGPVPGGR